VAKIKSTQKQTVMHKSTQKQTVIHKTTHTTKDGATQTLLRTSDEIKVCLNMV
jgi:hypothetical protein